MKEVSIQYLKSMAYMGHKVYDPKGKKLTWQKLEKMEDTTVTVAIGEGFNKTFLIIEEVK
jgi:hypothetical protein